MARTARKPPDDTGEVQKKDFKLAVKLLKNDILPAQARVGEHAQEMSTAYKAIRKQCHIQVTAAKTAFKLADLEDAKREDWLRGFNGLLVELGIQLEPDLVDAMAQPAPAKKKPVLAVVVSVSDGSESDLTDAADTAPNDLATTLRVIPGENQSGE
jgi:hypothetical protein